MIETRIKINVRKNNHIIITNVKKLFFYYQSGNAYRVDLIKKMNL